ATASVVAGKAAVATSRAAVAVAMATARSGPPRPSVANPRRLRPGRRTSTTCRSTTTSRSDPVPAARGAASEPAMSGRQRQLTMRFLAEPSDVNFGGKAHGGQVMKWIDQAGYAAAVGWSGHYSVTVAVGGIRFVAPVRIGDLVTVDATLIHTGTTSMH